MQTNIAAWTKIIQGLVPDTNLSVTEADGNLIVSSTADLSDLQNILQASPDTIQNALAWEIREKDTPKSTTPVQQSKNPVHRELLNKVHSEKDVDTFARVIHTAFIKDKSVGCPLVCKSEEGQLVVRAQLDRLSVFRQEPYAALVYGELCDWFNELTPQQLLTWLCELPGQSLTANAEDSEKWKKYKQAIIKHDTESKCIKFDMQLLKQLALPPQSKLETRDNTEDEESSHQIQTLTINIQNLFNYLSRSSDWIVVQDNAADTATPILFAKPLAQCARKIHLMLYLDNSASLGDSKAEYETAIEELLEKFRYTFSNRQNDIVISYRKFGETVSKKNILRLDDTVRLELNEMRTSLHKTVFTANDDIREIPEEDISVMILITDGSDNSGTTKPQQEQLDNMSKYEGNVYVVGLGNYYDEAICENIAQITGGSILKIDSLNELSNKITDMSDFYSFYRITIGDNPAMPVRVNQSEHLYALDSVKDGECIKINDNDYIINTIPVRSPDPSIHTDADSDDEVPGVHDGIVKYTTEEDKAGCALM